MHVARLARLDLSDEEVELFTAQLRTVLDHAADVASLDLSHLEPSSHPIALHNVLRADEPRAEPRPRRGAGRGARGGGPPLPRAPHRRGGAVTHALSLAAEVRSGQRSAREVVDEALAAVATGDGELNAFLTVLGDEARAERRRRRRGGGRRAMIRARWRACRWR